MNLGSDVARRHIETVIYNERTLFALMTVRYSSEWMRELFTETGRYWALAAYDVLIHYMDSN